MSNEFKQCPHCNTRSKKHLKFHKGVRKCLKCGFENRPTGTETPSHVKGGAL